MIYYDTAERYLQGYKGTLSHCRSIDDDLIAFKRDGSIIGVRSCTDEPRVGESFYSYAESGARGFLNDSLALFDASVIALPTALGNALIFTELFGVSGVLFAVIPHASEDDFAEYVNNAGTKSPISFGITQGGGAKKAGVDVIDRAYRVAQGAISCSYTHLARYSLGAKLGEHLADRILSAADFVGCVGSATAELDAVPNVELFMPEWFVAASILVLLTVRDHSKTRDFDSKIIDSHGHLLATFCISPTDGVCEDGEINLPPIRLCESIAEERGLYFDCFYREDIDRLIVAFIPESEDAIGRGIKQDARRFAEDYWRSRLMERALQAQLDRRK